MTTLEKNLMLSACESAIQYSHANAGISSWNDLEEITETLRTAFATDPDNVNQYDILLAWRAFLLADPPSLKDLSWIFRRLQRTDSSGRFDGSTLFDGMTTFTGGFQI